MGFEAPERTYALKFDGDATYAGLEVRVRPPSLGEALEHLDMSWMADDTLSTEEQTARLTKLYTDFISRLESWNVTRKGVPVPATMEGLKTLDNDFGLRIIRSWLWETSSVPAPLDDGSNTGAISVDESQIPMDTASLGLAS